MTDRRVRSHDSYGLASRRRRPPDRVSERRTRARQAAAQVDRLEQVGARIEQEVFEHEAGRPGIAGSEIASANAAAGLLLDRKVQAHVDDAELADRQADSRDDLEDVVHAA